MPCRFPSHQVHANIYLTAPLTDLILRLQKRGRQLKGCMVHARAPHVLGLMLMPHACMQLLPARAGQQPVGLGLLLGARLQR